MKLGIVAVDPSNLSSYKFYAISSRFVTWAALRVSNVGAADAQFLGKAPPRCVLNKLVNKTNMRQVYTQLCN